MAETFEQMLKRRDWVTVSDALKALHLDQMPPDCPTGRMIPALVCVYVEGKRWPVYRPDAQALTASGGANWLPVPPESKPASAKPGSAKSATAKSPTSTSGK